MTATTHPSGRRAAATWVGGTGAFLLLAAAAVFVAVRWDQLPDAAKLGMVGGLTGAFLTGGRALRRTLPATGDVLFHLGAFLVPVDLAAACLRAHVGWRATLLAEGIACVTVFTALARTTRSVALERAAVVSVLALAAGVAGVSPLPATVLLAAFAVAAEMAGLRRPAAVWAAVAGLAPALGATAGWALGLAGGRIGAGTLGDLGLSGTTLQFAAAGSGLLAAFVLARQADAARDLRLAFLALASLATGLGTSASASHLSGGTQMLGLAGLFVVIELVALLFYEDDFWGRPLARAAFVCEPIAGAATLLAGAALMAAPFFDSLSSGVRSHGDVTAGAALLLVALGWLTADARRVEPTTTLLRRPLIKGSGWRPGTAAVVGAVASAVQFATASSLATAAALTVLGVAVLLTNRAGAEPIAAACVPWAVVTAWAHPAAVPLLGVAGAMALAYAAATRPLSFSPALAVEATLVGVAASLWTAEPCGAAAAVCIAAATTWAISIVLDVDGRNLGDIGRAGLLAPLGVALALPPSQAVWPAAVVMALFAVDAVRLQRPEVGLGASLAVQVVIASLARANGLELPWVGFALCVCAVAWTGLAAVVPERWRGPFAGAAGVGLAAGLVLAHADVRALSDALLVAGGIGITAGIALRMATIGHLGGAVATAGLMGHLAMGGVVASEAYVAPVALQLLAAGWQASRRTGVPKTSSWVAYAPSVALLGGAAFAERLNGGAGWHALVAGAVGVVAVAAGGWRRLAGPMVVGTGLLVALSVRESLSALAGVPTWGWLALGGSVLLGAAVVLERSDASPLETGRRVVDVLADRFD